MKRTLINGLVIILVATFFIACGEEDLTTNTEKKEEKKLPNTDVKISCVLPQNLPNAIISENIVKLKNKNTGVVVSKNYVEGVAINVEEGVYTISFEGKVEYSTKGIGKASIKQTAKLRGIKEDVSVTGKELLLDLNLFLSSEKAGFVLSEIFFTGTKTPKGSQYSSDKFIEIYNNSDNVLYADGLCVSETAFLSSMKNDYHPNIMNEYVIVDAIYTVPGTGKDYPVQPGATFLLVDVAKNHTVDNSNSFDLSKANFEWFDDDTHGIDVDIPSVPNLIRTYTTSASVWPLHNRGFKSYVLFKMDKPAKEFLAENKHDYYYNFVWSGGTVKMDQDNIKVANTLVIDAVSCAAPSKFEWLVMDPSLDISYTHSGDANDERYGKSVKRKVSYTNEKGRIVLMDTNNSSFDFIPTAEPTPGVVKSSETK